MLCSLLANTQIINNVVGAQNGFGGIWRKQNVDFGDAAIITGHIIVIHGTQLMQILPIMPIRL